MRYIYFVTDNPKPSWGIGVIYHHVHELIKAGKNAFIMHQKKGFKIDWLFLTTPVLFYSEEAGRLSADDTLVIPEVMMDLKDIKKIKCRKIVFIQNVFWLFVNMPEGETHKSLGFEKAMYIMPHILPVIETRLDLPGYLIPPFVADYFYKNIQQLHKREKLIVVYPKFSNLDYGILVRFIKETIKKVNHPSMLGKLLNLSDQWKLLELTDKSHKEVAAIMQKAAFFINLNTFEAFNTSVPEAMAAGCINICYEAFGPADFLENNKNAFVFPNNHIYPLVQKVIDLISNYDASKETLEAMRIRARNTADKYTLKDMVFPLLQYFNDEVTAK